MMLNEKNERVFLKSLDKMNGYLNDISVSLNEIKTVSKKNNLVFSEPVEGTVERAWLSSQDYMVVFTSLYSVVSAAQLWDECLDKYDVVSVRAWMNMVMERLGNPKHYDSIRNFDFWTQALRPVGYRIEHTVEEAEWILRLPLPEHVVEEGDAMNMLSSIFPDAEKKSFQMMTFKRQ